MTAGDYINATIGDDNQTIAVGKNIHFSLAELSDKQKLDMMVIKVFEIRERVSVLRTWLIALAIAFGVYVVLSLVAIAMLVHLVSKVGG